MALTFERRNYDPYLAVGAPLLLAVLELFHPHPPHDLLQLNFHVWLWIHYLQIPLFPLSALAVAIVIRGLNGTAASIARVGLFVFAIDYTAFDTAAGIVTGELVKAAHASGNPEVWRPAIEAVWDHPIIGGSPHKAPVLAVVGTMSWLIALLSTAIAMRRAGVSWGPVLVIAFAAFPLLLFKTHAWPGGPITFGTLSIGAAWLTIQSRTRSTILDP